MTETPPTLTRVLLHRSRLQSNLRLLRSIAGDVAVWPVIKANAYGHGAVEVARELIAAGVDTLCFANPFEASRVADAGLLARSIILTPLLGPELARALDGGFESMICNRAHIDELSAGAMMRGIEARVHILVDTGMSRGGVPFNQFGEFLELCLNAPGIRLVGVMSHLACADAPHNPLSVRQRDMFSALKAAHPTLAHLDWHFANSAGLMSLSDAGFDAVRPGISLYGLNPFLAGVENAYAAQLQPVLEWQTAVIALEELPAGSGVSYGHQFITSSPTLVATIPVGYGDGLSRSLSGRIDMLVQGQRCRQIGTITMDQCMLDGSALRGHIDVGDAVTLIGRQGAECISVDEIAAMTGTINYEVVTSIAERVSRLVVD